MAQAPAPTVNPAFNMDGGNEERRKKSLKIFGIVMGSIVGLLAVAYLVGVFVFMGRFFPNTAIASHDISLKTPEEVHAVLDEAVGDYAFRVKGQGIDLSLTAKEVGMTLDAKAVTEGIMTDVNAWAWPIEVFKSHDETGALAATYSSTGLGEAVDAAVAEVNATATQPVNATIAFSEAAGGFSVVPEVRGTALDAEKVTEAIVKGFMRLETDITLTADVLVQPTVFQDDPRLKTAIAEADALIKADLKLMISGNLLAEVTPQLISSWVTLTPEVTASFDDAALSAWIDSVAAGCNTVGSERTYTRPDGKVVTVSGGTYGWEVDSEALRTMVTDGVRAGTVGTLDIPVISEGNGFTAVGDKDWGNRYCDIDLSEQHARFYDDAGTLVWESDVITGSPGEHATPTGVYYATWGKASPSMLIGEKDPETGKPEYETEVRYWMPFIGNAIGLHDADWQYNGFGGDLYARGYGSHGCVNLPVDAATALYGIFQIGDVVVVHW